MIEPDAVVHELTLPVPPGAVFDMFVDPERLVRWIGISADLEPRPGGRFRFEIVPGQFCEGHYVTVERPTQIRFTWGWTEPSFHLPPGSSRVDVFLRALPEDAGTQLRLVHSGLETGRLHHLHDDGWTEYLSRLEAALEADRNVGQHLETHRSAAIATPREGNHHAR